MRAMTAIVTVVVPGTVLRLTVFLSAEIVAPFVADAARSSMTREASAFCVVPQPISPAEAAAAAAISLPDFRCKIRLSIRSPFPCCPDQRRAWNTPSLGPAGHYSEFNPHNLHQEILSCKP